VDRAFFLVLLRAKMPSQLFGRFREIRSSIKERFLDWRDPLEKSANARLSLRFM
jgi:hypothetical protein